MVSLQCLHHGDRIIYVAIYNDAVNFPEICEINYDFHEPHT
jgi:hypothetical protein